jgi:hypothetical protein
MEAIGLLVWILIKWGILTIAILGILRILFYRKDGKKHWRTKILTCFFVLLASFIFISSYKSRHSNLNKISGDYKLHYYKCEECLDCIVRLNNDETYTLLKNGVEIDKGDWDFSEDFYTIVLKIENGTQNDILDSTKTISYIKNEGCQAYWRNQNLLQPINGTIIKIDSAKAIYGVYSFVYLDLETKDTIQYKPKFIGHPWLNDKISVGCLINKEKNSLIFRITKPNGDILTVSEQSN